MENISIIISLILSIGSAIGAIIIYFANFYQNKRTLFVSAISQSRLVYIEKLTNLLSDFIEAYINKDNMLAKSIKYKIELYFNSENPVHKEESELLNKCIQEECSDINLSELIKKSQELFTNIFEQIKLETYDKSFSKKIELHYKKNNL